jgi:hypothetical protein
MIDFIYKLKNTAGTAEIKACGLSNYGISEKLLVSSDRLNQEDVARKSEIISNLDLGF